MHKLSSIEQAILDIVCEMGDQGAPSGPIYAALMTFGMSYDVYQRTIAALVDARLIRSSHHVLYAIPQEKVA